MDIKDLYELLKYATDVNEIDEKRGEIASLIPEIEIMFDYDQHNYAHQYNLWIHSLWVVIGLPRGIDDDMLYLAALLHDIGKPESKCMNEKNPEDKNWHYYGHMDASHRIVKECIIPRLKNYYEILEEDEKRLLYYVLMHDDRVSIREKHLKRHLKMATLQEFKKLMLLEVSDAKAHIINDKIQDRINICAKWADGYADEIYEKIM